MCRYRLFRKEWKKFYHKARTEFVADPDGVLWMQQMQRYQPNTERWFCKCESYKRSAYHNCKHLVRLYVSDEGMTSNKPPMPAFGEVYRQSRHPILWIKGVHLDEQLTERDLQPEANFPPIANPGSANGSGNVLDADPNIVLETLNDEEFVEMFSEGEEEVATVLTIDVNDEQDAGLALACEDKDDGSDSDMDGDHDDGFDGFDADLFERENEVFELEQELEGDDIKEQAELFRTDLGLVIRQLEDLMRYPSGHPHLREVPRLDTRNMVAVLVWAKRSEALDRTYNLPRTFGASRQGNVFK